MAWLTGWDKRKKITVNSAEVGTGTHSNFPLPYVLDGTEIVSQTKPLMDDVRFTNADGTTVLNYGLSQIGGYATRDGVWTWYNKPVAIYDSVENAIYYAPYNSHELNQYVNVWKYDLDTKEYTSHRLDPSHGQFGDDHNNGALCMRSDGRLLVFTPPHGGAAAVKYFISTSPRDITSFGTVQTIGGVTDYSYSQPWRLSSESAGQKIWLFIRRESTNWGFSTSTDDGDTFTDAVAFWQTGTGFPYFISASNGVDRMDFLVSDTHPVFDNQKIWHFYYDGQWRATDGALINGGKIPAAGFSPSDLNASCVVVDDSAGTDLNWTGALDYNSNGDPRIIFTRYIGGDGAVAEYHYASHNGTTWDTEKITDAYQLTGGAIEPFYTGIGAIDPEAVDAVYLGTNSGTEYPMQRWVKSGTWALDYDLIDTAGSTDKNFRPYVVQDHPGGNVPGKLLWCSASNYTNFVYTGTEAISSIRAYPPLGGYAARVNLPSVSSSADTEIYVYYGNSAAANAENWAGVYVDAVAVPDLSGGQMKDSSGVNDAVTGDLYEMVGRVDHDTGITMYQPVQQMSSRITPYSSPALDGPLVDMTSLPSMTVETFVNVSALTVNEQVIISNLEGAGSKAGFMVRLEPASPANSLEVFFDVNSGRFAGTSAAATVPFDTDKFIAVTYDGDVSGASKAYVQTDTNARAEVATQAGVTTLHSVASTQPMQLMRWPTADPFNGSIGEVRVWSPAKTQEWSDTTYNSFSSATFTTTSAEQLPGEEPITGTTALITLTAYAGTVTQSIATDVTGSHAGVTLTAYAGTVTQDLVTNITGSHASISVTTYAGTVDAQVNTNITGTTAGVTLTAYAGTVTQVIATDITGSHAAMSLTAYAGNVSQDIVTSITGSHAAIEATSYAGTVDAVSPTNIVGSSNVISLTAYAGTVQTSSAASSGVISESAQAAKDMLREFGEPVVFKYVSGGDYDPATGGDVGSTTTTISGYGYPSRYNGQDINGTSIQSGDIRLITELLSERPKAQGWECRVDNLDYKVMQVQPVRESGADVIYIVQLRK